MMKDQQSGATVASAVLTAGSTTIEAAADAGALPANAALVGKPAVVESNDASAVDLWVKSLQKELAAVVAQQKTLADQQKEIIEQLRQPARPPRKDFFDMAAAVAPILSGIIIAVGGAYFTTVYNQQQLKLQEIQTIEKFIPHLMGDEKSKKAAILAISSLTDAKLAAKVASLYASEGTVSALEQIRQHGTQGDRKIAGGALARALDTIAENYSDERRYQDAIATYKKALTVREQTYGGSDPRVVPGLNRLADLYRLHGDFALAETMLKRAVEIQRKHYGGDSLECIMALKQLQALYFAEGADVRANAIGAQISECEARLKTQGKSLRHEPALQIDGGEEPEVGHSFEQPPQEGIDNSNTSADAPSAAQNLSEQVHAGEAGARPAVTPAHNVPGNAGLQPAPETGATR